MLGQNIYVSVNYRMGLGPQKDNKNGVPQPKIISKFKSN